MTVGYVRQILGRGGPSVSSPEKAHPQAGALLTNFAKAFYCIDHELLIAKLYAYGFD